MSIMIVKSWTPSYIKKMHAIVLYRHFLRVFFYKCSIDEKILMSMS